MVLSLTDCRELSEIKVVSLRNKNLKSIFKTLCKCPNLQEAYLQGNRIINRDLIHLGSMPKLVKLNLSNNQI